MRVFNILIAIALIWTSAARADGSSRVRLGGEVDPIKGAVAFCRELPARCEPHPEARMKLDAGRMAELVYINLLVNIEITFQAEPVDIDVWQDRNFKEGDCEDYALRKRRELIELGWPPGALRLAIIKRKQDDREMHAILVASTDSVDYVMDIPGEDTGQLRVWNPKEFFQLSMVWGADAKWYALAIDPSVILVGAK